MMKVIKTLGDNEKNLLISVSCVRLRFKKKILTAIALLSLVLTDPH